MANIKNIFVVRGDCKMINVTLLSDGEEIVLSDTDTVELTVRKHNNPASPVLLYKSSVPGSRVIELHAEDTLKLEPGKYSADIRYLHNGCFYTVWGISPLGTKLNNLKNFHVMSGVSENG